MIFDQLMTNKYEVVDGFLTSSLMEALRNQYSEQHFKTAGTGREQKYQTGQSRGDRIHWLGSSSADGADALMCGVLENVRKNINRSCMMGLHEFEAHLACYKPGTGYTKHKDAFADGKNRRKISAVFYLNDEWSENDGGELVVYDEDGNERERILPKAGRAVFFVSEDVPHEVLPALRDRWSVACWFKD